MGYLKDDYGWEMLSAVPAGTCEMCAVAHESTFPHDVTSLAYQYKFFDLHGRWPAWSDALAHCTVEMKEKWTKHLAEMFKITKLDDPKSIRGDKA